jgi:hypothetical protein
MTLIRKTAIQGDQAERHLTADKHARCGKLVKARVVLEVVE